MMRKETVELYLGRTEPDLMLNSTVLPARPRRREHAANFAEEKM